MKILLFSFASLFFSTVTAQKIALQQDTLLLKNTNLKIVNGKDISTMSPNEQGLIIFMESLKDEQAFEFLKLFVVGEIHYIQKKE